MERSGKTYTRDEIRKQLSGHLCRCTGYENIVNAVEKAVDVVNGVVGEGRSGEDGEAVVAAD
jgi:carbon-monoxide dehydrogenase small subunit